MPRFTTFSAVVLLCLAFPAAADASWTWPLRGEVLTPYRNGDDPYAVGQHRGIDIAGSVGAPVVVAAGGEVRYAGVAGSSGLTVSVRTDDGFDTSYLHLSSASVRAGERVSAGERLGAVGTSGTRSASQPHLHFGVREAGTRHAYRDPLDFLPAPPAAPVDRPRQDPHPVPVAPVPLAAPAPVASPDPVPVRAPRPLPADGRMPAGARARSPVPHRLPAAGGVRAPVARRVPIESPGRVLAPARGRGLDWEPARLARPVGAADAHAGGADGRRPAAARPARGPSEARHPARGSGAASRVAAAGPDGAARPGAAATGRSGAEAAGRRGPDLGMLLACVGVLMAAALLGVTDGGRTAAGRGAIRLRRALRPLPGSR